MFTSCRFGNSLPGDGGSSAALSAAGWPVFWYCCHGSIVPEKIKSLIIK